MMSEEESKSIFANFKLDNLKFLSDKDFIKFLIYIGIIAVLTFPLMNIVARAWSTGLMEQSAKTIRDISQFGTSFFTNLTIGFLAGSTILMYLDRKKRMQAFILTVGIILIISYLFNEFNIEWNLLYIVPGIIIGIMAGGGYKKTDNYRRASLNISMISVIYIIAAYLNIYLEQSQPTQNFFIDSAVVITFSYFFGTVMNYKGRGKKIFVLGPGHSGKTVFMIGCYDSVLKKAESPVDPNDTLLEAFNELYGIKNSERTDLSSTSPDWSSEEHWLRETLETSEYEFICEVGSIFPKEVLFRTTDYSGAFLANIPDYMYKKLEKNSTDVMAKKYIEVADEVTQSDKIIFILDASRNPDFKEITEYIKIINRLKENGKTFEPFIIVTKCDIFMAEFQNRNYRLFKNYIEKKLDNNPYTRMLFVQTGIRHLYPVFYETTPIDNGKRIPLRDENGNLFTFGFDEFISVLMS